MNYKTILVHVDGSKQADERTKIAATIATNFDAHLVGAAATGLPSQYFLPSTLGEGVVDLSALLDKQRFNAKASLDEFAIAAERQGVRSLETRLIDDEAGLGLCMHARYSDLVIMSQFDPEAPMVLRSDFPEYVVVNSGRPVLIVPHSCQCREIGNRVLVAWDASMSATRAVTNAIPLLQRAAVVQIVVFGGSGPDGNDGEQGGADLALYLARHAVNVEVSEQPAPSHLGIGDALLTHAAQFNADLLVMGGYGHSRFRELVMGGATRSALRSMTVPVLMSH